MSLEYEPLLHELVIVDELLDHSSETHYQVALMLPDGHQAVHLLVGALLRRLRWGELDQRRVLGHRCALALLEPLHFAEEGEDQDDLLDGLVHLQAAHHNLDDTGHAEVLAGLLFFGLLVAEEDLLIVVIEGDELHEPTEGRIGLNIVAL